MGIFDKFRKKKTTYDVTNISVKDLDVNFIFDYDLSSWEVVEVYEYDWGDHIFTKEYKITDGTKTYFLSVDDDDELEIILSTKANIRKIGDDIIEHIQNNDKPQNKLIFGNEIYYLDEGSPGYMRCMNNPESWMELMSWDYYNDEETKTICIEQFNDNEFDASTGKILKEFEISNIVPSSK